MKRVVKPQQATQEDVNKYLSHKFNLTQFLFDKQLAFVEDPNPFKVAVCSRRAGKTIACAAHLLDTAIKNPNTVSLYITLSRNNAKKLVWRELINFNEKYKLNGVLDLTELSITFPNKSIIYISGCKDQSEVEKFRGLPLKLCYIDECQSFKAYIKDLIDDVIAPALIDYAGELCLIGTPGPVPSGYFHECSVENDAWSKHHWTFWDNPHLPIKSGKSHQAIFERELKRRGVLNTDPSIQREWYGKWILDSDSLLIHYSADKNHYDVLPPTAPNKPYNYVMGVDVGFKDADAICILAWNDVENITYLIEELVTAKQGLTELVQQIKDFEKKYPISKIVMDMGGLGLKMGEEMIRQYQIPVEAAIKARKFENIALLNDALRSGRFKAKAKSQFAQDSYLVEIDRDKSTPERIKVSDRFHSDIIDSVLYAFKLSYAFSSAPETTKPKYGSKEWAEAQSSEMFEAELAGHQAEVEFTKKMYGQTD